MSVGEIMNHKLKIYRRLISLWFAAILIPIAGAYCKAAPTGGKDAFTGGWLLVVSSNGEDIGKDQISPIMLKISKQDVFYNVVLEAPAVNDLKENKAFYFGNFLQMNGGYSGKYLLNDDGKSITHLNKSVTIEYKKAAKMLCEKGLGCFRIGNQSQLIRKYNEHLLAKTKAEAKARAEAEAGVPQAVGTTPDHDKSQGSDRRALIESYKEQQVAQPADANSRRLVESKNIRIGFKEDNVTELDLDVRTHVEFAISMERMSGSCSAKVILLDEAGHTEWQKLEYSAWTGNKQTKNINGPCPALLKIPLNKKTISLAERCDLDAGRYYLVVYDAHPLCTEKLSPMSVTVEISTQIPDGKAEAAVN